eukprot:jgi/Mesvir1/901/Mv17463-RA.1
MGTKQATQGERAVRSLDAPLTSSYKALAAIGRLSQEAFSTANSVVASEHIQAHRRGALLSPWPLDVSEIPGVPSWHKITNTLWECSMEHALADMDAEEAIAGDRERSLCTVLLEDEPQDVDPQGTCVQAAIRAVCSSISARHFASEVVTTQEARRAAKRRRGGHDDNTSEEEEEDDEDEDNDQRTHARGAHKPSSSNPPQSRRPGLRSRPPLKTPAEKSLVVLPDRMRRPAERRSPLAAPTGKNCQGTRTESSGEGEAPAQNINKGAAPLCSNTLAHEGEPPGGSSHSYARGVPIVKGGKSHGGDPGTQPESGSQYVKWAAGAGPAGGRVADGSRSVTLLSGGAFGSRQHERGEAGGAEETEKGGRDGGGGVSMVAGAAAGCRSHALPAPKRIVLSKKGERRRDKLWAASIYPHGSVELCLEALFADVLLALCACHKEGGHPRTEHGEDQTSAPAHEDRADAIGGSAACRSVAADAVARMSELIALVLEHAASHPPPEPPGDTQEPPPQPQGGQALRSRHGRHCPATPGTANGVAAEPGRNGPADHGLKAPGSNHGRDAHDHQLPDRPVPGAMHSPGMGGGACDAAYRIVQQAKAAGFPQSVLDATCRRVGLPLLLDLAPGEG